MSGPAARIGPEAGFEPAVYVYLDHLEEDGQKARHTLAAYGRDLQQLARFLYPRLADLRLPLSSITTESILLFVKELQKQNLKPSTISRKVAAIRSFFRYACLTGAISANPAATIGILRESQKRPESLSLSQLEHALEPSDEDFAGVRDRAILELFYGGGIRLSELVGLSLSSLDPQDGTLLVKPPAAVAGRTVPVGRMALKRLKAYLHQRASVLVALDVAQIDVGALFISIRGRRLRQRAVQRLVKRQLSKVVDRSDLSPHLLRQTFAAHLLEAGADILAVKELLGLKTLTATQIYRRPDLQRLQSIYQRAHPRY